MSIVSNSSTSRKQWGGYRTRRLEELRDIALRLSADADHVSRDLQELRLPDGENNLVKDAACALNDTAEFLAVDIVDLLGEAVDRIARPRRRTVEIDSATVTRLAEAFFAANSRGETPPPLTENLRAHVLRAVAAMTPIIANAIVSK